MEGAATIDPPAVDASFVDRFLAGDASEDDARRLVGGDAEVAAFTLMEIQRRLAHQAPAAGPNTPSAAIPPYAKPVPPAPKKGRKKGGHKGHPGRRRKPPVEPDRTREHPPGNCPDCGEKLRPTGETRERLTEDIPEDLKPVITGDILHRGYCDRCAKRVEPKPPDILPRCTLGNRTLVLSSLLHFLPRADDQPDRRHLRAFTCG